MSDSCNEVLDNLYPYLDVELDASTLAIIRHHLSDCPPCGDRFDFEARLRVVVRERLTEQVPPEFMARLHAVIHRADIPDG